MSTVTGTVKVCKQSKFGWGLLLEEDDTKWYNSKFEIKASAGDKVTFDDGGKNYVNKLKVNTGGVHAAPSTTTSSHPPKTNYLPVPLENSRAIIRQNALTNAREFFCSEHTVEPASDDSDINEIIRIARVFEEYTSGDGDLEAAKTKINSMEIK